jgi:hypothetical protein
MRRGKPRPSSVSACHSAMSLRRRCTKCRASSGATGRSAEVRVCRPTKPDRAATAGCRTRLVAGVRRGGEQHQVTVVLGQALQQLEAQLLALPAAGAGVGFVHDHALGRDGQEVLAVALALDVVEAHHHDRVVVEQADAVGKVALDARGRGRGQRNGLQVKAGFPARPAIARPGAAGKARRGARSRRGPSARAIRPASMVLPIPTSSAIRRRTVVRRRAINSGTSW